MASWKGKPNLIKSTPPKPTAAAEPVPAKKAASATKHNEPKPSTSKSKAMAFEYDSDTSMQAHVGGIAIDKPSAIKELPAIRSWLNNVAITNPEVASATFTGFLYRERISTFIDNKWPTWLDPVLMTNVDNDNTSSRNGSKRSSGKKRKSKSKRTAAGPHLCTGYSLAMAGFMYCPEQHEVKCFICHRRKNADEFSNITDPWKVHKELFAGCPFVKLGKRVTPDDYKMGTILILMGECEAIKLEYEYELLEKRTHKLLEDIQREVDEEEKNEP